MKPIDLKLAILITLTAIPFGHPAQVWGEQCITQQIRKLTAADADSGDFFGWSVAVSGNTAVIGAYLDEDGGSNSGSAYVFSEVGGVWQQIAKLTAADPAVNDTFGWNVSISGDTAIIGAPTDDDEGSDSGSAYVFREIGGVWQQIAKLTASDGLDGDLFGISVSLSGSTAVIGAYHDDDAGGSSGSAYVFREVGGVWQQIAKLTASDAEDGDQFGFSVSLSGSTAVIGASYSEDAGARSGSVYVFRDVSGVWQQIAKLTASDAAAGDEFGISVSISGDTAIIGAYRDDNPGTDSGSAYVFREIEGVWQQIAKLNTAEEAEFEEFGLSVSISGDTAVIGDHFNDEVGPPDAGAAHVFREIGGVWQRIGILTAADADINDNFGISVAVSGNVGVVGAHFDDDAGSLSGSAYVYDLLCDADGDGVKDYDDVCPINSLGLPVNCQGRPLRDCDGNCLFDMADIQCIVDDMLNQ